MQESEQLTETEKEEVIEVTEDREEITTENTQQDAQKKTVKRSLAEYIKRYIVLIVGLVIMSFGVALSINAKLGTSPVSSIPQVTSVMSGGTLSVGVTTIIVNTIIVLLQWAILRRRFKLIRLIQIPVCTVFGLLIDLAAACVSGVMPTTYWGQWIACIAGIVLVGVGVAFEMAADVITLAGEGLAQALCMVTPVKFGYMKVMVDLSFVIIATALSFIFLQKLEGVREGTLAAAIFVGLIAKALNKYLTPFVGWLCADRTHKAEGNAEHNA